MTAVTFYLYRDECHALWNETVAGVPFVGGCQFVSAVFYEALVVYKSSLEYPCFELLLLFLQLKPFLLKHRISVNLAFDHLPIYSTRPRNSIEGIDGFSIENLRSFLLS